MTKQIRAVLNKEAGSVKDYSGGNLASLMYEAAFKRHDCTVSVIRSYR